MRVRITHTRPGEPTWRDVLVLDDVLELEVEPLFPDQRTQAERNADNAIRAARLERVERDLERALGQLHDLEERGTLRVSTASVKAALLRALAAPIEP